MKYQIDKKNSSALIQAETGNCDTDCLGKMCEELMEKELLSLCVAYREDPSGCKFVVRSLSDSIRADEVAGYLSESVGAGGGQSNKAGGFLSAYLFQEEQEKRGDETSIEYKENKNDYANYLWEKMKQYFEEYQVIRADEYQPQLDLMERYEKKKIKLGVVRTLDFLKEGTPILIRTMEGDMECVSADDLFIMIGIDGEVYPIRQEKFDHSYEFTDGKPEYDSEYEPVIHNTITGEAYHLIPFMKTCQAKGVSYIYAKQLKHPVKIFTQWDQSKYLKGSKGDYLAVRGDDFSDVYVIEKSVFLRSYEKC